MDEQERQRDEELIAFTNALLGKMPLDETERPPLASTVEMLAQTLRTHPLPDGLQERLQKQLAVEWRDQRPGLFQTLLQTLRTPVGLRLSAIAAVALLAVALAVLLPAATGPVSGTAAGGNWGLAAGLAVAVLLLLGGIAYLVSRR